MSERRPEVADVLQSSGATYLETYGVSQEQRQVLRAICRCRTAALGGHRRVCERCGHEDISYNSCRNRHCPKCQAGARARWLEARERELLDVPYFHVVFTVPAGLGPLALQNKRLVYGLLFRAVSETLLRIARDPKHLGADIGFLTILHTWGQTLHHHPHIHCVVPAGGICADGSRWVTSRENFLFSVRVLSALFRKKYLSYLRAAYKKGKLDLYGRLECLRDPQNWYSLLADVNATPWIVYAKPPFGGQEQVLKYLARYTHRVAISNGRLISVGDGKVSFWYKDYKNGNRRRRMTIDAVEFTRRFFLHVLPTGFMRIRYYGFLANRVRGDKLALAKRLIGMPASTETSDEQAAVSTPDRDRELCPACKKGRLVIVGALDPDPGWATHPPGFDTS